LYRIYPLRRLSIYPVDSAIQALYNRNQTEILYFTLYQDVWKDWCRVRVKRQKGNQEEVRNCYSLTATQTQRSLAEKEYNGRTGTITSKILYVDVQKLPKSRDMQACGSSSTVGLVNQSSNRKLRVIFTYNRSVSQSASQPVRQKSVGQSAIQSEASQSDNQTVRQSVRSQSVSQSVSQTYGKNSDRVRQSDSQ